MSFQFASPLDPRPSFPSRTRSAVRLHTDGSNLHITIATRGPRIPRIDQLRFTEAAVRAGLRPFLNRADVLPVFAVRVGGWYFRVPVTLGSAPGAARKELQAALGKARSRDFAGTWTISFTLTDTAARKTVASRSGSVPPRLRREIAAALLGSCRVDAELADCVRALAHDVCPSDHDLFEGLPYTPRIA